MAFYNEYRPRRFADVVGHTRTIDILRHQVQAQMYHHAYLFSGYSGTGKTTCARILAAAMCCQRPDPVEGEPCGECSACKGIFAGSYWDLRELDAARFRGVGDIEELLSRVGLFPIGKRKVYIIDECHMLTEPAWNCLLKTIEEPPSFFTLILCTTEYKAIPETVRSRCCSVHFERLTVSEVMKKLERICDALGFVPERARLDWATQTGGNLREAENRLEQVYTEFLAQRIENLKRAAQH